jgi:hypothetical protein
MAVEWSDIAAVSTTFLKKTVLMPKSIFYICYIEIKSVLKIMHLTDNM